MLTPHRGEIHRKMGHYEEALADLSRAIDLNENDVWIITNRGETYRELERYEEALADFDRAIVLNEKYDWAIAHRGLTYSDMGRYEEALADYDCAIAVNEHTCAIRHRRETYEKMGRYDKLLEETLAQLDQLITLDEKNAQAIAQRGEIYRTMGRYEEALTDFNRAIALDETMINSLSTERGLVLSCLGRYAEAIESYRQIMQEDSDVSALYNIAVAMVRWKGLLGAQGHINAARKTLLNLVDTDAHGIACYGLGGLEALIGNAD